MMAISLIQDLKKLKNSEKAKILQRFFKTGPGQYGEGDLFLGISVPDIRKLARNNTNIEFDTIQDLLKNKYHEVRLCALIILVLQFEKVFKENNFEKQNQIVRFYLKNTMYINNWDLVDLSCYKILGLFCFYNKKESILKELVRSKSLWERRISIVSCYAYIKNDHLDFIYSLCPHFFNDKEELIHKACGWMLRESGKRDEKRLILFLKKHLGSMPKIMFRYATEKLSKFQRNELLNKRVP